MAALPFTLRQLEVFETLCNLRSFRRASEELGISQASVSNQLKVLEDQLGVRLLMRESGKRPRLTAAGAAFLADLQTFWTAANTLASHRRDIPNGKDDEDVQVNVLIGNYLFKDYIRPKLDRFFETHPSIHLNFSSPTIADDPRRMLARQDFDLALFQDECGAPPIEGSRELARIRAGVFGNRTHMEGRNSTLTAQEVSALPFLLPPSGTYYEDVILDMLSRRGIRPTQVSGRTNFFDVMAAMFERGESVGVTLEPLLAMAGHRNAVLLYRLDDWRLVAFRNPKSQSPQVDAAERFIISSVLDDPSYPRLTKSELDPDTPNGD